MPIIVSVSYCLLALLYLLLSYSGEFAFGFIVKILPLLLLLSWVFKTAGPQPRWLISALLLCMLGDALLAWDGSTLFIYGLAAFLAGHICYLLAMRPYTQLRAALILPYTVLAAAVLSLMWPNLGAIALPVLLYIVVLLAMSFATWCSGGSNRWLIAGGLVFVCSDSLLGLNKFYQPIPAADTLIMLTYYTAQYALIRGLLLNWRKRPGIAGTAQSHSNTN